MRKKKLILLFLILWPVVVWFLLPKVQDILIRELPLTLVDVNIPKEEQYENQIWGGIPNIRDGLLTTYTESDIVGEFTYTHISKGFGILASEIPISDNLYVEKQSRRRKLLSNLSYDMWGIEYDSLHYGNLNIKGYIDKRKNLYFLTESGNLYVIKDGSIIGKITNILKPGEKLAMFSDENNTYAIVARSVSLRLGPFNIKSKFKIDIP